MNFLKTAFLIGFCGYLVLQGAAEGATSAVHLDGHGYVELPQGLLEGLRRGTVECWVKWDAFNNWSRVFDFGREGNAAVVQNEKKSNKLYFAIWDRDGNRHRVTAKKKVKTKSWHHIAVSTDDKQLSMYIDGVKVGGSGVKKMDRFRVAVAKSSEEFKRTMEQSGHSISTSVGSFGDASGGNNYIGKSNWGGDELFAGNIAEFRVWEIVRTQSEILRDSGKQLKGDEPGLRAYWRFENIIGEFVQDETGRGHHAILRGSAVLLSGSGPEIDTTLSLWDSLQLANAEFLSESRKAHVEGRHMDALALIAQIGKGFEEYALGQQLTKEVHKSIAEEIADRAKKAAAVREAESEKYYRAGMEAFEERRYYGAAQHLSKVKKGTKYKTKAEELRSDAFRLCPGTYLISGTWIYECSPYTLDGSEMSIKLVVSHGLRWSMYLRGPYQLNLMHGLPHMWGRRGLPNFSGNGVRAVSGFNEKKIQLLVDGEDLLTGLTMTWYNKLYGHRGKLLIKQ